MRAVARRRYLIAALCTAVAITSGITAVRPPAPATVAVLVADADLAVGTALRPALVRLADLPAGLVPDGALRDPQGVVGATLGASLRRGSVLTDAAIAGPGLLAGAPAGSVVAPVRFADTEAAGLLVPGQVIDIVAADDARSLDAGSTGTLVTGATVLAVPTADDAAGGLFSGASAGPAEGQLVLVVGDEADAAAVARAAGRALSFTLRAGRTTDADRGRPG